MSSPPVRVCMTVFAKQTAVHTSSTALSPQPLCHCQILSATQQQLGLSDHWLSVARSRVVRTTTLSPPCPPLLSGGLCRFRRTTSPLTSSSSVHPSILSSRPSLSPLMQVVEMSFFFLFTNVGADRSSRRDKVLFLPVMSNTRAWSHILAANFGCLSASHAVAEGTF